MEQAAPACAIFIFVRPVAPLSILEHGFCSTLSLPDRQGGRTYPFPSGKRRAAGATPCTPYGHALHPAISRRAWPGRGLSAMAIYHLTAKTITRARGQSAAAKFQYINRAGRYSRQRDKCLVSGRSGMPKWAAPAPLQYWRAADRHERKNACLAREIECALPVELDLNQQVALVKEFIERNLEGQPCSWAIHAGKGRNPHVHIMFSDRTNDEIERDAETWFRRHNPRKPEEGGARKNRAFKPKSWLVSVRESWAEVTNRHLKAAGFHIEIDHRSHAERGIPEPPGMHYGPTFHARPGPDHPRSRRFKERQQRKKREEKTSAMACGQRGCRHHPGGKEGARKESAFRASSQPRWMAKPLSGSGGPPTRRR